MAGSSLLRHIYRTRCKIMTQTHGLDVGVGVSETYVVPFQGVLTLVTCPVRGFRKGQKTQVGSVNTSFTGTRSPRYPKLRRDNPHYQGIITVTCVCQNLDWIGTNIPPGETEKRILSYDGGWAWSCPRDQGDMEFSLYGI